MAEIIKAGVAKKTGREVRRAVFDLQDFSEQADAYLDAVRDQAARILADAKQESDQIRQQAAAAGRQEAVEAATKTALQHVGQQLQTLLPALQQASAEIVNSKHAWMRQWENNVVTLAAAIAQHVVRRELQTQPDISLQWIREALELAAGKGRIRLHLNPQDHATAKDHIDGLAAKLARIGDVEIVSDGEVTAGGCRVVTEYGAIDQQLESQLKRIEEELHQ